MSFFLYSGNTGGVEVYKICHTEQSSRRQRQLEAGLLDAMMVQPYEKITLTELCLKMNVPRKTFYRYFPAKEDCLLALIDHTLSDCNTIALSGWEGGEELNRDHLLRFFVYWQEQKAFLDAIERNGLAHLLLDRTEMIVDAMKEHGRKSSFAEDQLEYFIAHGLMASVLRWHRLGFDGTAEEMAAVFSQVLHSRDISITRLIL